MDELIRITLTQAPIAAGVALVVALIIALGNSKDTRKRLDRCEEARERLERELADLRIRVRTIEKTEGQHMFNKDCLERVARAFVTGCVSAATALSHHANDHNFWTALTDNWTAIAAGGALAAITLIKAQWGLGRGEDPDSGSWKGLATADSNGTE